ncbi:glycosyltransferase family protein 28 [Wolffia australiana]
MGEDENSSNGLKRTVFVTVGTTSFDALVRAVDTDEVKEELWRKGYSEMLIQLGRGTYIPSKFSKGEDGPLSVDYFTFSPTIADYLKSAALVISHAGSGSIFETLRLGKPLMVVVNKGLMDNHQSELAAELAARKHLFCACPQTLARALRAMDTEAIEPYFPGDARPAAVHITNFLGFSVD